MRDRWERRSNNCLKAGRRICYSLGALAIPFKWSHRSESLEEPEDATDDRWWMEEMVTGEVKMVQDAWKNHPMRSTGILYKTPSKYGPNAGTFGVPPLDADAPKQEAAVAGNGAQVFAAAGDAKKKGEPTSDPTWPDVKRWFHVDRDAKVLRLYQDKKGKIGSTEECVRYDVLKKEGEIHLTKYTVIKLYTGGRKGPVSALEQGARAPTSASRSFPTKGPDKAGGRRQPPIVVLARRDRRRDTAVARAAQGSRRVDGLVLAAPVLAVPRGRTVGARARRRRGARRAPAVAVSAAPLHNHKKKEKEKKEELPTKAQLERAFSLFRLYLGTSPSEKRGGGDEKKVTAAELRFLLTSLGDKLRDDQVDAMVQQAGGAAWLGTSTSPPSSRTLRARSGRCSDRDERVGEVLTC